MELRELRGIGKARLAALSAAGIFSLRDLLFTLPVSYKDTTTVTPLCEIRPGMTACVSGVIKGAPRLSRFKGKSCVTAALTDGTGTIELKYYNQPWMKENLSKEGELLLFGRVFEIGGRRGLNSPSIERERGLTPVYRALPSLSNQVMRGLMKQAIDQIDDCAAETLPDSIRREHALCEMNFAVRQAHFPDSKEALMISKRRMAFESLLLYQAAMAQIRGAKNEGVVIRAEGEEDFWESIPFPPTGAQRRVLHEIALDLAGESAMSRLVQGDVGCGKTAVAFGAMYLSARAGYQACLMAPTEILARQHLLSAQRTLEPLGVHCGLLVGGMKAKEKRDALQKIRSGEWQGVIGTHALLSEGVEFENLGLCVTDEQHRFGVRQRRALAAKAEKEPNALVMSATPIPRSLALVLYGDLDISVIDEMPPGRTPVETRIVPEAKREGLYSFIKAEAKAGRQTYIVCPLVEENEMLEEKSAQEEYAALATGALRELRIGLTYGNQEAYEKARVITAFSKGELDVLVATTVIEVGVNVPAASIMVIENAERFGLSQLHQLRGRVGRGAAKSWCFLMASKNERLAALCASNDGFYIAQEDLRQRGPGDFLGTRQHGEIFSGIETDVRLIEETRDCLKALSQKGREMELALVNASAKRAFERLLGQVALN